MGRGRPGSHRPPPASGSKTSGAKTGQQIYAATCTRCHGPTPPFTHQLVSAMGKAALARFISTRMPPGNPVSAKDAQALVQYFNSL